jgi:hypothetical protein
MNGLNLVTGENVVGYIFDSTWKPIVCSRSLSLSLSTAYLKTSVSGSGADETIEPTENSATANIDGLVSLQEPGTLSLADLQALQESHTPLLFRFQRTSLAGNVYTSQAMFFIVSSQDTGSFDGMNTFTIEMRRTGSIIQIYVPTPNPLNSNKVKRYPALNVSLSMAGGEVSFTSSLLIGKDILSVVKDGMGQAIIITSGIPVGKECLYDTTTGTFTFAVQFETGEEAYVLFQDI